MATHPGSDPQDREISVTAPASVEPNHDAAGSSMQNRRAHRRQVVAHLSWLDNVRVKYGPEVTLLDLSPGGAQVETAGYPLQPGSAIVLELKAGGKLTSVPAQVIRCQLASLSPIPTYRGSVRFKRPFDFPEGVEVRETSETDWDPALEYERLNLALHRAPRGKESSPSTLGIGSLTPIGAQALDAGFAMIGPADTTSGPTPFACGMARLFHAATRASAQAAGPDALINEVIERLRRLIPALSVRLVPQGGSQRRQDDIISFQVPTDRGRPAARLLVEFAKDCPLEEWHLQLLQGTAQLIGALTTFTPVA